MAYVIQSAIILKTETCVLHRYVYLNALYIHCVFILSNIHQSYVQRGQTTFSLLIFDRSSLILKDPFNLIHYFYAIAF